MSRSKCWRWAGVALALAAALLYLPGCTAPSAAQPDPLVRSQAWRMGASASETLQEVQQATDWQTLESWKTWGFGADVVWVRVQLRAAPSASPDPWVLRVRPAFLDHLTLYDPSTGQVQHTGDALVPTEAALASANLTFLVPALPVERQVYLRLRSDSARALLVDVLPYSEAHRQNRLYEWAVGFILAISGLFGVWAAVAWRTTGQPLLGVFALKQAVAVLWGFFIFGLARVSVGPLLPEGVLTTLSSTVFVWLVGVTLWFLSLLVAPYRPNRRAWRAVQLMAMVCAFLPALQWLDLTRAMLIAGNVLIPVGLGLLLIAMLTASARRVQHPLPWRWLLAYLCVYGTVTAMPPVVHLGLVEGHAVLLFSGVVHAVLDGFVVFVVLHLRSHTLQRRHQKTLQKLERLNWQSQAQRRMREEQSQLFAMLAHEMKTPLATLQMWMESGTPPRTAVERTIADMSAVVERCIHTGQLAEQGLMPCVQPVEPLEVTRRCIASCRAPERVDFCATGTADILATDAQMLGIALGNLLDNACKYADEHSRIAVHLRPERQGQHDGWRWEVVNTVGPAGLPDPERLFEKYYRSPLARRLSGSGLGLYLVKRLADLLQGAVGYEAQRQWVVFSLWLPRQHEPC